MLNQQLLRF